MRIFRVVRSSYADSDALEAVFLLAIEVAVVLQGGRDGLANEALAVCISLGLNGQINVS